MKVLTRHERSGVRRERLQHATRLFLEPNDHRGVIALELAGIWIEPEVFEPNGSSGHMEKKRDLIIQINAASKQLIAGGLGNT